MPRNDSFDYNILDKLLTKGTNLHTWTKKNYNRELEEWFKKINNDHFVDSYVNFILFAVRNQSNYIQLLKKIRNIPNIEELIKKYND